MNSQTRSGAATLAALTLVFVGGVAAGCGGSSSSGGPEDAFIGRWIQESPNPQDPNATGFTMSCNDPAFPDLQGSGEFLVWTDINFEHGVLTSLTDTSGNCASLDYDVKGKAATVPTPDPYSNQDPVCGISITRTEPTSGASVPAILLVTPGADWSFTLLDTKSSPGGAPQGRLVGTAKVQIISLDANGNVIQSTTGCTYGGMDTFFRLTQP